MSASALYGRILNFCGFLSVLCGECFKPLFTAETLLPKKFAIQGSTIFSL